MRKIIYTHVAMYGDYQEATDKDLAKLQGKTEEESTVWGRCCFSIADLAGVSEYYPDEEGARVDPDKCNIMFHNGKSWSITTPFEEMKALYREFHGEGDQVDKTLDLGHAIMTLAQALKKDPDLFRAYQANIAMAFRDQFNRDEYAGTHPSEEVEYIHKVANQAAINFLNLLTKDVTL